MIDQLSNKYLVKKLMVYLDLKSVSLSEDKGRNLQVEIIDQLSNKYLLNILMVYLVLFFCWVLFVV